MQDSEKGRIHAYLAGFFPVHDLKDDDDIFALGFVNSMFAMQLIAFLESEFGITIENEDLDIANFRSLGAMEALVTSKVNALTSR